MRYFWHKGEGAFKEWPDVPPRPRIHVISDVMDPVLSHADGQMHDSKSAYYQGVKAKGYEIVGNDDNFTSSREDPTTGLDDAIQQAVHEVGI